MGSNSALHVQAGLKKISEHIRPAFRLSGALPTLNWDAGYKGQRGLGRSCFGSVGRTAYLLPPLSCAWDPRGWSDLFYGIPRAQGYWNYKAWEQQTETKQPCIKCSKYFSKLRLQATNGFYYLPLPIPKYLLLGSGAFGSQLLPRLQVNHCQGPARERIQLRCHSASCVFGLLLWTLRATVSLSREAIALCVSDLIKPAWRVHLQVTDGVGLCHPIKYPLGNQPVLPCQELNLWT